MKKLIIVSALAVLFSTATFAATRDFQPITTKNQAEQDCALPSNMQFTPNNPIINSAGIISGQSQAGKSFESWNSSTNSHNVIAPLNGTLDAQFKQISGNYGYQNNGVITCFYTYTGFTGVQVTLDMRSN